MVKLLRGTGTGGRGEFNLVDVSPRDLSFHLILFIIQEKIKKKNKKKTFSSRFLCCSIRTDTYSASPVVTSVAVKQKCVYRFF